MKAAEAAGSTVILAVDPDADRLQVMERDTVSGSWRVFSGNEIGTLLSWWAFKNYKEMKGTSFDGVLEWINAPQHATNTDVPSSCSSL